MMKKILLLITVLMTVSYITKVSIADTTLSTEKQPKVETVPRPYSDNDLYGYWFDVNNTPEVKIIKLMTLAPNGIAIDSLQIQVGNDIEEVKQDSKWKFNPESSVLTQNVTNITYKTNGKIQPKDFGEVDPVKVSVTIQKRGNDIFMGLIRDDGALEIYQKITAEMKDEIHKKAQENAQK